MRNDLRVIARFCDVCGSPVARRPAAAEHKHVTVLFADVVGSMNLATTLDAERLQEVMNELFNRAAAVVQRYQGTVDKFTGDGLMAVFGAPLALEDHALRACIAALEIHCVTNELAAKVQRHDGVALQIRVGLNSGEVIAGEIGSGPGRYTAVGHPVGMAQRMEAAAPPGGVLCSLTTARLVEDATLLGAVEDVVVKGADAPVPARRLLVVESSRKVLGRGEGVMLGRDAELRLLRDVFDANRGCLIGIVGAPGVGKSRLTSEFTAIAADQDAEILVTRCEAHTTAVAFSAISLLLRSMFDVDGLGDVEARARAAERCAGLSPRSADMQILFEAMGIGDPSAPPLELGVEGRRRRLVEVMMRAVRSRSARTVLVLEDAHWIDASSDDILAMFAESLKETDSMLVVVYRPEFNGALQRNSDHTVGVEPLADTTAVNLVRQLLGDDFSLAGLAERISVAAVGNPFFIEEIVRDLVGRGVLAGNRGSYRVTGNVDEIAVPGTVQAVLAARIDRLSPAAKSIVNAAAVIGTEFDVDTLQLLLSEVASEGLAELVSTALIDQTELVPQQRYCFHHPLVRTVAYSSQLSATRGKAHRRLAAAIEGCDTSSDENAALIATHLEAAGELAQAYRWHMRAAEWLRPRDMTAARAQWDSARRMADQLPDDYDGVIAMRIAPRTMLVSTMLYVGGVADSDERYRELCELTKQAGDLHSLAIAMAGRVQSLVFNDIRVPEAATLASELERLVNGIDCDAASASIILNAVAMARLVNCEFDAASQVIDAILALPGVPLVELAPANATRAVIEMCCGRSESGRRKLREWTARARPIPVLYSQLGLFSCTVALLGIYQPDGLLDQLRDALRGAESFGDVAAIAAAQWAYGTVLLRTDKASHDEAIDMLERTHAFIGGHRVVAIALATIDADLAVDAARKGHRDKAINDLRESFNLHVRRGFRVLVGCTAEALLQLLVDRGRAGDLAEAHRIIDTPQVRQAGIPATDLWWLRSRALLAKAEGDSESYRALAEDYLALCEKLGAVGRLAHARRMVDQGD